MKIMISACLMGKNCKYNGGNNLSKKALRIAAENEMILICPEVMGGLPTPREPSEIRDGRVISRDGRDVDAHFRSGALKCLEIAQKEKPDRIVLKSRSPSCGVKQRYDGTFRGILVNEPGITAELLIRNGFCVVDIEECEAIS